ncbi:hypothetical protein GJ496_001834 [Pomphorhynchus laevis]|nr:hypothetical protein GJ496_001834 [Pomphorhynchus laevis]
MLLKTFNIVTELLDNTNSVISDLRQKLQTIEEHIRVIKDGKIPVATSHKANNNTRYFSSLFHNEIMHTVHATSRMAQSNASPLDIIKICAR